VDTNAVSEKIKKLRTLANQNHALSVRLACLILSVYFIN